MVTLYRHSVFQILGISNTRGITDTQGTTSKRVLQILSVAVSTCVSRMKRQNSANQVFYLDSSASILSRS